MSDLLETVSRAVATDPLACRLLPILARQTGTSSSGYPYLDQLAWEQFRDNIPHILAMGRRTQQAVRGIEAALVHHNGDDAENMRRACKVVEQVLRTAAITAPPSLWLLRHLLGAFQELGLLQCLLAGKAIYPERCVVKENGRSALLDANELNTDLLFLLSLGFVEQYDDSFRIAGHPRVRRVFEAIEPVSTQGDPTVGWKVLFDGGSLERAAQERLLNLGFSSMPRSSEEQNHWIPTLKEIELGYRLVPVVLGLRAANRTKTLSEATELRGSDLSAEYPQCAAGALEILTSAGWCERDGERYRVTSLGERGFQRGPGPFGIIQTYHPYMTRAVQILKEGTGQVWVQRGDNVAASQDANKGTFLRANDALDRFCADTGFTITVFIEHAIGRGEATRQRFERSGEDVISYVGADLEDAAIDQAVLEQRARRLPQNMLFVRNADIGDPTSLFAALAEAGLSSEGAVMMVGNGFHEIRNQSDVGMQAVFQEYCDAGVILLFTEENALSIDDIRQTAWNTYHAGFKYVHEKSGQGLRPAQPRPAARLGNLRAAWSECAQAGGYRRLDAYCDKTRTIYPYTPKNGINPSISVNHFLVPAKLADSLGV